MLLKIDVKPEDIIYNNNGRIVIKLHYFSEFSVAAHLVVTEGETMEDLYGNKNKDSATMFVSVKGKISTDKN